MSKIVIKRPIIVTWLGDLSKKESKYYEDAAEVARDFEISVEEVLKLSASGGYLDDFQFEFAVSSEAAASKMWKKVAKKGPIRGSGTIVAVDVSEKTFMEFDKISDLCAFLTLDLRIVYNVLERKTSQKSVDGYLILYENQADLSGLKPDFEAINV